MPDSSECAECGGFHYSDDTIETYEVLHSFIAKRTDGTAEASTSYDWHFCSAKCLVAFVNRRFGPDAVTEDA
jgi:hypothetical protein